MCLYSRFLDLRLLIIYNAAASENADRPHSHQLLPRLESTETPESIETPDATDTSPSVPPQAIHIHFHGNGDDNTFFLQNDELNQMHSKYNLYPQSDTTAL